MEESNKTQTKKKLSYDELKAAAQQISVQAEALYKENAQLKKALQQEHMTNMFAGLEFRFKVLKYKEFFDEQFINYCVEGIREAMTPEDSNTTKEEVK